MQELETLERQQLDGLQLAPAVESSAPNLHRVEDLAKSLAGVTDPPPPQPRPYIKSKTFQQMSELAKEIVVDRAVRSAQTPDASFQERSMEADSEKETSNFASSPPQKQSSSPTVERGSDRVNRSLEQLPNSPTKQLVSSYAQDIQSLLELAQAQQDQIYQLQSSVRSLTKELQQQRLAHPRNTSWWELAKSAVTSTWKQWEQQRQQYQAAAAIYQLYNTAKVNDAKVLQLRNYRIEKEGNNYTFSNSFGQVLMQFRATPLGVQVDAESVKLTSATYQDIERLRIQQARREQPDGAFSRPGTQEAASEIEYYVRAQKIASHLVNYATKKGQDVTLDGQFSYKWKAFLNGEVQIYAKDGRDLILAQAGNQMLCRMNEQDLGYFEKALEKLRSLELSSPTQSSHSRSQKGIDL